MKRLLAGLLMALGIALLAGCKDDPKLAPNSDFSINVIPTPNWWPREDKDWNADPSIARMQQDYIAEHGKPEAIRVIWTRDRSLMRQGELADRVRKNRNRMVDTPPELEWIYLERGKVVRFLRDRLEERDLDDRLRAVALYGDPNEWKVTRDAAGRDIETHIYYNEGLLMTFLVSDGSKVREERFQPVTGYQRRM
jgi:hypothetical protein